MEEVKRHSFIVPSDRVRLDKFLVEACQENQIVTTRSLLEKAIRNGHVTVEGVIQTKPGNLCYTHQKVDVELTGSMHSDAHIVSEKLDLEIIFEDDSLLAINKRADMIVHPGAGNKSGTVLNGIKNYLESPSDEDKSIAAVPSRYGLVHRLDKDTTGILLFAKSDMALSEMQRQFADREVTKKYLALVYLPRRGRHAFRDEDSGLIELPIGRDPKHRTKMAVVSTGKMAKTSWKVLERFSQAALLEVQLFTGRTHQIRVHMQAVQSAVLGDSLYGLHQYKLDTEISDVIFAAGHQLLHAQYLEFVHPVTKLPVTLSIDPPAEFAKVVDELRSL